MDLRHLSYFVAVAEERSFSRGANRLRVSQPTLSQQIRSLEREIGGALFMRTSRHVELTPAGQELLVRGKEVLRAADAALLAVRDRARPTDGVLHIGAAPVLGDRLLPDAVALFRSAFPDVRLIPHELTSEFEASLLDGRIDVGIMMLPLDPGQVHFSVLGPIPRLLFVPKYHPLAAAKRARLEDVLDLCFIPVDRECAGRKFVEFWQLEVERGETARTSGGEPARSVAEVGQRIMFGEGVAIGIAGLEEYPSARATSTVAVRGLGPAMAVVARRRQDSRPPTRAFCDLVVAVHHGSTVLHRRD